MSGEQLTTVVRDLQRPDGRNANVIRLILRNDLLVFFVCGEPGTGKTTLTKHISNELQEAGISVEEVYFDTTRKRTLAEINQTRKEGEKFELTIKLDEKSKQRLSDDLVLDIQAAEQKITEKSSVILVENPGFVGNVGYNAMVHYVKRYGKRVGILANATDSILQQHSGWLRQSVGKKMEDAESYSNPDLMLGIEPFLNKQNIRVTGKVLENLPPLERNRRIGDVMGDSSSQKGIVVWRDTAVEELASIKDFDTVRDKILDQLVHSEHKAYDEHGVHIERAWGFAYETLEDAKLKLGFTDASRLHDSRTRILVESAASYRNKLDDLKKYGLPEENIIITANLYNPDAIFWWNL